MVRWRTTRVNGRACAGRASGDRLAAALGVAGPRPGLLVGGSELVELCRLLARVAAQAGPEAAHALAQPPAHLRQAPGAEHEEHDDENDRDVKGILKTHG